jgi:hypothetical protein
MAPETVSRRALCRVAGSHPRTLHPCRHVERGACSAKVKKLKLRQDLTDEERGKAIAYLKAKGLI